MVNKITTPPTQNEVIDKINELVDGKQDTLVSGTNIKTVGGNSLVGSGNVAFPTVDQTYSATSTNAQSGVAVASAIGNGSVTINQGGTARGTFTMNQSSNLTIDLDGTSGVSAVAVLNKNTASPYLTLGIWQGTESQWTNGVINNWYYWQTSETALWTSGGTLPSSVGSYTNTWIAYGNNTIVISSYAKTVFYSKDNGNTWNSSFVVQNSDSATCLCSGNNKIFCITNNNCYCSTDGGESWERKGTLPVSAYPTFVCMKYIEGKLYACAGNSSEFFYSLDDGDTWQKQTLSDSQRLIAIEYGNGSFIGLMNSNNDTSDSPNGNSIAYSQDGINWEKSNITGSFSGLVYANGKFVTIKPSSKRAYYSVDNGQTWQDTGTISGFPSYKSSCCLKYGNGTFLLTTYGSDFSAYSTDGITWYSSLLPSSGFWPICYCNNYFVAVNKSSTDSAIFTVQYDKCYTDTANPTTTSVVYSEPETTSSYTISSVTSGAITLSNNNTYYYNQSGNTQTYQTIGDAHPEYLCFIDGVGVKMGNTMIATNTPITTTITSSSTDTQAPSAKAVYDEIGEVESALNTINSGS